MTGLMEHSANKAAGALMLAAVLALGGEARAQSSGGGPLGFLDNIFTGSISRGSQAPPSAPRPERRHRS